MNEEEKLYIGKGWEHLLNGKGFYSKERLPIGMHYRNARFTHPSSSLLNEKQKIQGKNWLENPYHLVITGKPGRGKTWFCVCLLFELYMELCNLAIEKGRKELEYNYDYFSQRISKYFWKAKNLDDCILKASKDNIKLQMIRELIDIEYLIIDDFGLERETANTDDWIYQIIDSRINMLKPTILTTNKTQQQIYERYDSRIISRLKNFKFLEFSGEDLRGK
jgi:DNA replication protein DnaC